MLDDITLCKMLYHYDKETSIGLLQVCIVTSGYDTILRTQLVIHVGEKQYRVVCKDGRVLHFSHEPQELRDFILCQLSQHQVCILLQNK